MRLASAPQWLYLIRDFPELYQTGSADGSAKIRSHMAEVRKAIGRVLEDIPPVEEGAGETLPACIHLDRAFRRAVGYRTGNLARSVDSIRDHLTCRYGYERVPRDRIFVGLVLFAPRTTYPALSALIDILSINCHRL